MKLLNSLYNIISETSVDCIHEFNIRLNAGHDIYAAHFPGEPITPGVCILQIANELLEYHMGCSLALKTVKNVKFLSIISPVQNPDVKYTIQKLAEEGDVFKAQISVTHEDILFAKLSIICSAA